MSNDKTSSIVNLLNALSNLRWDELDQDAMEREWNKFFEFKSPEFYLHTLETVLNTGKHLNDKKLAQKQKVILSMLKRNYE